MELLRSTYPRRRPVRFYGRLLPAVRGLCPFLLETQAANLALLVGALLTKRTLCLTALAGCLPVPAQRRTAAPAHERLHRLKRLARFLGADRVDPVAVQLAGVPAVLARLGPVVDRPVVVGDRGFGRAERIAWPRARRVDDVLRLRRGAQITPADGPPWKTARPGSSGPRGWRAAGPAGHRASATGRTTTGRAGCGSTGPAPGARPRACAAPSRRPSSRSPGPGPPAWTPSAAPRRGTGEGCGSRRPSGTGTARSGSRTSWSARPPGSAGCSPRPAWPRPGCTRWPCPR